MHDPNISHQNPLAFLLRDALIYPDRIALAHPDVKQPAYYTYSVWSALAICSSHTLFHLGASRAQRVQNLAYALVDFGIRPQETVAVLAPNTFVLSTHSRHLSLQFISPFLRAGP